MLDPSWIALIATAVAATAWLVGGERRAGFRAAEIVKVHGTMAIAICLGAALYGLVERGVTVALAAPPGLHLARQARHPGFLLGAVVSLPLLARILPRGLSLPAFGDLVIPGIAVALAATRVSCWLAGCCFGEITDLPWGVVYPHGSPAAAQQIAAGRISFGAAHTLPVHPLQLYFGLLALGVGLALALFARRKTYDGQLVLLFLAVHENGKGLLEFLRPVETGGRHLAAVSFGFGLVGLAGLAWCSSRRRPTT